MSDLPIGAQIIIAILVPVVMFAGPLILGVILDVLADWLLGPN